MKKSKSTLLRGMKLMLLMLLFASIDVFAYDLVVTLRMEGMKEKIIDFPVLAATTDGKMKYADGMLNETDSTFVLKNLPERELGVLYCIGSNIFMERVPVPVDSVDIEVQEEYMPRNELNEIVVNGVSRKFEDNKQVYLPSKRDKRISKDGTSLLQNMAIPTIAVSPEGGITTSAGDGVSVFIDYLPASSSDIANIRTADVRNVEIYDYPEDPRFGGERHVVNFIMAKYEYGGYTKLNGWQRFIEDNGGYSAFSKFAYKKMTYDISAGYSYNRLKHTGSTTDATYTFGDKEVDYNSTTLNSHDHNQQYSVAFRAIYQEKDKVISNIVGLSGRDTPHNTSASRETFSSPAYISGDNKVQSNSDNIDVAWNGNYQFFLPKGFSLIVNPGASYTRNKRDYSYSGLSSIVNDTKENAWRTNLDASITKKFGRHSLSARGIFEYSENDIDYFGTSPAQASISDFWACGFLFYRLSLGKFYLAPSVNIKANRKKINGYVNTTAVPGYNIDAIYSISNKRQLQIGTCIYYTSVSSSQMADNYQITDQINAIAGNPALERQITSNNVLSYTSFANETLSYTAYIQYMRNWRNMAPVYTPVEIGGHDYMLRNIVNEGFNNYWSPGLVVTAKLFKNALTLRGTVSGYFINQHGPLECKMSKLDYNFYGSYDFSNFYISANLQSKSYNVSPFAIRESPFSYKVGIGWSNGHVNINALAFMPFSSSYKSSVKWAGLPNYSFRTQQFSDANHRSFQFSVTYSLSYGKKVRHEEISAPQGVESGILQ